ncbi:hypothetical protein NY551_18905 [Curtobacterium flaccumfaciens pv. oortii]|uniref:hypothetical protein n=1 Tax=Curtobacterium flaccumfaciens TaxID=2035 RepID=UPI00265A250D|nr:hypothetical protein [Curtobacterium flaccumfaciens]MCS5524810.1 hypothetical protein [Curtobacterium flaccumfaciens pv. oortii]
MSELLIHKDCIDLLVSAIIVGGLHGDRAEISPASRAAVAHADDMGRILWNAVAVAASRRSSGRVVAPEYEWRPVAELMGLSLRPAQLLQVERTRRFVLEATRGFDGWLMARSTRLLQMLAAAVEHGLQGFPRGEDGDYRGIEMLEPQWRRVDEILKPVPGVHR